MGTTYRAVITPLGGSDSDLTTCPWGIALYRGHSPRPTMSAVVTDYTGVSAVICSYLEAHGMDPERDAVDLVLDDRTAPEDVA